MAIHPFADIFMNGKNISANLADVLLSVTVTDEAEDKSDRVTLVLDDRDRVSDGAGLDIPLVGSEITVVMGYRDGASREMGTFFIDQITVSGGPATLNVSGRSANMPKSYRSPRTKSYHQMTLGEIIQDVAGRSGYSPAIDASVGGIVVRHADQLNESDMAFATRLAAAHDAVARPVDGRLVLAKRGTGQDITGAPLDTLVLTPRDVEPGWTFNYSARDEAGAAAGLQTGESAGQKAAGDAGSTQSSQLGSIIDLPETDPAEGEEVGGVRAFFQDVRSGELQPVEVGTEPFANLRYTYHNESEARAAASSEKNKAARGNASFSCTTAGVPAVQAETVLELVDFRPYMPTRWRIKSPSHTYDGTAYKTSISAELFQPEQKDVASEVEGAAAGEDDRIDEDAPDFTVTPGSVRSTAPREGTEGNIIQLPGVET